MNNQVMGPQLVKTAKFASSVAEPGHVQVPPATPRAAGEPGVESFRYSHGQISYDMGVI